MNIQFDDSVVSLLKWVKFLQNKSAHLTIVPVSTHESLSNLSGALHKNYMFHTRHEATVNWVQ